MSLADSFLVMSSFNLAAFPIRSLFDAWNSYTVALKTLARIENIFNVTRSQKKIGFDEIEKGSIVLESYSGRFDFAESTPQTSHHQRDDKWALN